MIVGVLALIVLVIFSIQNADAVKISFLGAQVRLSLAVALLIAAIAGALLMAAAGTARITQLRMIMRRDRAGRHKPENRLAYERRLCGLAQSFRRVSRVLRLGSRCRP